MQQFYSIFGGDDVRKSSGELFMVVVVIIGVLLVCFVATSFTSNGVDWVKDKYSEFIRDSG